MADLNHAAGDAAPWWPRNTFLVEEQAAPLRAAYAFDIRDPATGDLVLTCREGPLGRLTRLFRFSDYRRTTPFDMTVCDLAGKPVVRLVRGVPVTASRVRVLDADGDPIGSLLQRAFSIRGGFTVLDAQERPLCRLQGRSHGNAFALLTPDGVTLARITKQWAGWRKELFTSADHHVLDIDPIVPPDPVLRQLILASAISIGLIVKIDIP
ncbi:MAG: RNAase [Lentisphaerae bacterium]|nr:RNAase [Lentisphaerota bacterium]